MRGMILVSWAPCEYESDFAALEGLGYGAKYEVIDKVNEALKIFWPLEQAVFHRQKWKKKRALKDPSLIGCEVILKKRPSPVAYRSGKYLCADVEFDPIGLLNLPIDNEITGPIAADVMWSACELLEDSGDFSGDIVREVVLDFRRDSYTYAWTLKSVNLRKSDFRLYIDITESSEGTSAVLRIYSERHSISEKVEIYSDARIHPKYYETGAALAKFDLDSKISLDDLRDIKVDARGIHFAPTVASRLAADISRLDGKDAAVRKEYRITVGAADLSEEVCSFLGINRRVEY